MLRTFQLIGLLAASVLLAGCEDMEWGDSQRFKEDFQYSFNAKPGVRISVENLNGAIEIIGQDLDKVEVTGTKYASTEQVLQALRIDATASDNSVRIRTISPSGHRTNHGARYTIRVPRRADLERIASSNGSIRIEGVDGNVRVRTSNGGVRVLRLKGPVEIETSNGGIELTEHVGSAIAHTSNGGIRAEGVKGFFEATTSNGSINARLTDPEPNRPVKLESSNGSVTLQIDTVRNNDVRITTSNSSITLRMPSNANAQLRAHTSNSSVNSDFDMNVRAGQLSKSHVEGTLGSGGPLIDLSTSNGRISVQRL